MNLKKLLTTTLNVETMSAKTGLRLQIAGILACVQIIIFAAHYAIYKTFVAFLGITSHQDLVETEVVFLVLSLSFVLASVLTFKHHGKATRFLYTAAAVWIGTAYCLLIASAFAWAAYGVAELVAPGSSPAPAGTALMCAALLASAYGVWNSYQIKIRRVTVALANLPEQWVGRRAVLVADMHFGSIRNVALAHEVVDTINSLEPDIVLMSGDFYDGTPMDNASVAQPFSKLRAQFGTFFETGNHEDFGNKGEFLAALRNAGVHVLVDEVANVDGLRIIGLDYTHSAKPGGEERILARLNLDPNHVNILLKHVPDNVAAAEAAGVSLQLSGHTHCGQMWPLGYLAKAIFGKFYYGFNRLNTMQVYTTSGVGTWGPPQRIGTNAEIVVIAFKKTDDL